MKLIYSNILFLLISNLIFAQNYSYHSVIDSDLEWKTINYGPGISWSTRWWFDNNDIIIGNKTYKHLNRYYSNMGSNETDYYLREDSTKKVFLNYNSVDYLLYDFNANIGDTIWREIPNASSYNIYYYIENIDSVEIQGGLRKLFTIKTNWNSPSGNIEFQWIEGIGNTSYGILNLNSPQIGYSLSLTRVINAQSEIFPLSYDPNSVFDLKNTNEIYIYPNPSNEFIAIKDLNFMSFKVYDITGRFRLTKNSSEDKLDVSMLEKGVYFVILKDEKNTTIKMKFVKF